MANLKRVTSQDVAEAAGVSRTTVSLVLNDVPGAQISEETRQKVIVTARKLGYVTDAAARALVSGRSQVIGLLITRRPHHIASDGFLTQILNGLLEEVHRSGLRLLIDIIDPENQQEAYLKLIRSKNIDGIILSGLRIDDEALSMLEKEGIPIVLIGHLPGSNFCSVDVDNFNASRMAVDHLICLGHDRIACITNAAPTYTAAADRLAGYAQALGDAGLPYDEALVRFGDFSMESGFKQMKSLIESGVDFSAAFVASDELAIGAKSAIYEQKLHIPQDVALVGFDDLPIARYVVPPLTTVSVPALEIARQASSMLIHALRGEDVEERQVILETRLAIRESCGAYLGENKMRE